MRATPLIQPLEPLLNHGVAGPDPTLRPKVIYVTRYHNKPWSSTKQRHFTVPTQKKTGLSKAGQPFCNVYAGQISHDARYDSCLLSRPPAKLGSSDFAVSASLHQARAGPNPLSHRTVRASDTSKARRRIRAPTLKGPQNCWE
jgi:hypothetical protein